MDGFKVMTGSVNMATNRASARSSLETPRMTIARGPISETSLIGRRLGRVYDVAGELPGEMNVLLRTLDNKTAR